MMPIQRACDAANQVRNKCQWTAEGAVKCVFTQSILQRVGMRQLPGIWWYLACA